MQRLKIIYSVSAGFIAAGGIGLSYTSSSHAPVTAINQAIEQIAQQNALTQTNTTATYLDNNLSSKIKQAAEIPSSQLPSAQKKLYEWARRTETST